MINVKRWHLLLVLCFLALIGNFVRRDLFGVDAYASWACVVNGWCETLGWQQGFVIFLELMPPVMILAKVVMVLSLFVSIYAIWKIVQIYFVERVAWISVFFSLALCPIIIFEFSKFENELFALPFIFWGLYFLLKKFSLKDFCLGLGLFGISLFFWIWPGLIFQNSLVSFWFGEDVLFLGSSILEQQFFAGFLSLFFGVLVLPLIFFVRNKKLWLFFVVFLGFGFLSGKLIVLLVPWVVLGVAQLLHILESKQYNYSFLWIMAIIMIVGLNIAVIMQSPTVYEWEIIDESIKLSNDRNIPLYNDWSYGYWLWFREIKTKNNGTGQIMDFEKQKKPFVALTDKNLLAMDCELEKEFASNTKSIMIWVC